MKKILTLSFYLILLAGCTPAAANPTANPPAVTQLTPLEQARVVLTDYLDALSQQDYQRAADRYGGSLEVLTGYNPTLDPLDVPALLKNGCEFNGLMCLPPLKILKEEVLINDRFAFTLQLVNREGEVFEIGACCGADPEDVIPVNEFVFEVEQDGDEFKVLTLPPYVP